MIAVAILCSVQSCTGNDGLRDQGPVLEVEVPANGTFEERMLGAKINGEKVVADVYELVNGAPELFEARYQMEFIQHIDPKDLNSATFVQQVLVSFVAEDEPVVFVTQGYELGGGWDFESSDYKEELVEMLECNQVIVEHRFYGESIPKPCDWAYQTIENQVYDLHRINQVLREVFKGQKFISTGRSKGGENAIYYETYFPNDIDIAVPYVAPICFSMNDMRPAEFVKQVGSEARREKVHAFQQYMFDNRDRMMPIFERDYFEAANYNVGAEVIYDLCVLEYSFMCWQWYSSVKDNIPSGASDEQMLRSLVESSPPEYFSCRLQSAPSCVNGLRETGNYGYDLAQFKNTRITPQQCTTWAETIAVADAAVGIEFDPTLGARTKKFVKENTTEKMLFIYGAYDAWTAAAIEWENFEGKDNMFRYDCPEGDHGTFIDDFDAATRAEITAKIKAWLKE